MVLQNTGKFNKFRGGGGGRDNSDRWESRRDTEAGASLEGGAVSQQENSEKR